MVLRSDSPTAHADDMLFRFVATPLTNNASMPAGEVKLAFERILTAREIDRALASTPWDHVPDRIIFDLGAVEFVDPTALLYLCACAFSLTLAGAALAIELPAGKRVRDLMRRYRFGAALDAVLDESAVDLITDKSASYLREEPEHYRGSLVDGTASALARLTVTAATGLRDAVTTAQQWAAPDVETLLERYLGAQAGLVAPAIIQEALTNAVTHSGAARVVSNGFLQTGARGRAGLLTISFWDNGESIAETLRLAVRDGKIRTKATLDRYYGWYALFEADAHGDEKAFYRKIYSGHKVDAAWTNPELLLAATFPGVSRDPDGPIASPEMARYGRDFERRGMGLFILTSTAVNSFGGEVLVRAGDAFVNIKRAPKGVQEEHACHYRAGIVRNPAMAQYFRGNHVVIRLPLLPI